MKRTLLVISLLAGLSACRSESASTERFENCPVTAVESPLRDGKWNFLYPADTRIFAQGRVANGLRTATWNFYYHDGSRLARGSFDKRGRMSGKWIFWQPDGAVCRQRHGTVCIDTALTHLQDDHDHFEGGHLYSDEARPLWRIAPHAAGYGSGYYVDGNWQRPVPIDELRFAGRLGPHYINR
ncbi:MAG TPA: hypothetical protein VK843_02115 [Planctomycetota bacterium]|nr:hypothetical protein [Planctomycetota bacterium]